MNLGCFWADYGYSVTLLHFMNFNCNNAMRIHLFVVWGILRLILNKQGVWAYEIRLRGAVTIPHKIAKVTLKTKKPKNFEN